MASTLRKMFGISYFKQPDSDRDADETANKKRRRSSNVEMQRPGGQSLEDLNAPGPSTANASEPVHYPHKPRQSPKPSSSKKQRLDSPEESPYADVLIENTPKKVSLGLDRGDFDFDNDIFQFDSKSVSELEESDIESLSELDTSAEKDKSSIPLCRKLSKEEVEVYLPVGMKSTSDDEFSDLESDRNEDQRLSLLLSYQMKIEKMDRFLKQLLTEFQFHIEVSKIFNCKSYVTTLPGSDISKLPNILGAVKQMQSIFARGESPTGSWNIVMEKEDTQAKLKMREQLISMKTFVEQFVDAYLQSPYDIQPAGNSTMTELSKTKDKKKLYVPKKVPNGKKIRVNRRKYERKMYDFPDLREILQNLFSLDADRSHHSMNASVSANNVTILMSDIEEHNVSRCTCRCAEHGRTESVKSNDSGLPTKQDEKSDTIASSIGDFTLDNSQITAYSESLEQVLSYNSFNDSNLISTMLQKSAIERITFYVQVHNIQMTTEQDEHKGNAASVKENAATVQEDAASVQEDAVSVQANVVTVQEEAASVQENVAAVQSDHANDSMETRSIVFTCKACHFLTSEERGLLCHILDLTHCEKLHFLYKTAYIRSCFASGQEIQPSTVLNSMTMYRDDNKIVCFGDSKFACSLCFENGISGESVLIAHCQNPDHVEKRNRLQEMLDEEAGVTADTD